MQGESQGERLRSRTPHHRGKSHEKADKSEWKKAVLERDIVGETREQRLESTTPPSIPLSFCQNHSPPVGCFGIHAAVFHTLIPPYPRGLVTNLSLFLYFSIINPSTPFLSIIILYLYIIISLIHSIISLLTCHDLLIL